MHKTVREYVLGELERIGQPASVLDVAGRDVNGTVRPLFTTKDYTVLDIREGENVDIVADFLEWHAPRQFELVLCTSLFEHTPHWRAILPKLVRATTLHGHVIVTTHCDPMPEHPGFDEGPWMGPEEWYQNIKAGVLWSDAANLVDEIRLAQIGPDLFLTLKKF